MSVCWGTASLSVFAAETSFSVTVNEGNFKEMLENSI